MKANEAPEKIYLSYIQKYFDDTDKTISTIKYADDDIEYTRTDAFIDKALFWLKNHYRDYMYNPTGERLEAFFGIDMCNDFENYMKGE